MPEVFTRNKSRRYYFPVLFYFKFNISIFGVPTEFNKKDVSRENVKRRESVLIASYDQQEEKQYNLNST